MRGMYQTCCVYEVEYKLNKRGAKVFMNRDIVMGRYKKTAPEVPFLQ